MARLGKFVAIVVVGVIVAAFVGAYLLQTSSSREVVSESRVPNIGSPFFGGHLATGAGALSAPSATTLSCPVISPRCYESYNWGGYVDYNKTYTVTKVVGSWSVPAIHGATATTCPDSTKAWDSNSVWIGIDGAFTPTVEQTGTSSDCFYGTPQYYAWYEFYPAGSVVAPFAVSPGNVITATVTYAGLNATSVPSFKTTLTDVNTSSTFTSPTTGVPGALRESAEWIDEAPYYDGILPLTDVSKVTFTSGSATIKGSTHSIQDWGKYNVYWFVMVDYNFPYTSTISYVKAEPGALSSAGKDFSVTWVSNGP